MKHFLMSIFCITLLFLAVPKVLADNAGDHHNRDSCNNRNDCNKCDFSSESCDFSCSDTSSCDDCLSCCSSPIRTHVHFRSQGANTARELVGWQWELNRPFMCENYGAAYLAFNYQRTFKPERITNALFGGCSLRFAGSLVSDRDPRNELIADNFGLSRTYRGSVTFDPLIENFIVDLGFYLGLDCWCQGTYLRFHLPITHTRWNLRPCFRDEFNEDPNFAPCYVSSSGEVTPAAVSLAQALSGTFKFGDMQRDWCAGRISSCRLNKTALADIDVIYGYNWLNNDCYHLGAYIQGVLPTGPKADNKFLFSPVAGNGGFFELGGGLSAHAVLWSCEDQNLAVFLEGNVTHMFKNRQCRLFDLCKNGPFSRYLLLKEFDSNGTVNNYNGNLISATCFTNRLVDVRVDIKGDASIKLAYRWCGWGFDLGYNIYGHSREKIEFRCDEDCPCPIDNKKFAIKGSEGVCCFNYPIICVPLPEIEANADSGPFSRRIFPDGTIVFPSGSRVCVPSVANGGGSCNFDNPLATEAIVTTAPNNGVQPNATAFQDKPFPNTDCAIGQCNVALSNESQQVTNPNGVPVNQLVQQGFILCNSCTPTRFLDNTDIDINSGEAFSQLTHKIFVHLAYTCYDECGWNPQIGVGAEVEFDGKDKHNNRNGNCKDVDLNLWGVWFKAAISF